MAVSRNGCCVHITLAVAILQCVDVLAGDVATFPNIVVVVAVGIIEICRCCAAAFN